MKTPDAIAIGRAVRAALIEADHTQVSAAPLLGMSVPSLSRRINGTLPFTWPELCRVSDLTGVSVTGLIESATRIASRDGSAA